MAFLQVKKMCISLYTWYFMISSSRRMRNGPSCIKIPVRIPNISPWSNISRREISFTSPRAVVIGLIFLSLTPLNPFPRIIFISVCLLFICNLWMYLSLRSSCFPYLCKLILRFITSSGFTWKEKNNALNIIPSLFAVTFWVIRPIIW